MKKRILILDDEMHFVDVMKMMLQMTGQYEVRTTVRSPTFLQVALDYRPDLILLDCMMPAMDGGEIAAQIQADPVLKDTPFMFLTATADKVETKASPCYEGEQTFLPKAMDLDALVKHIDAKLALSSSGGDVAPAGDQAQFPLRCHDFVGPRILRRAGRGVSLRLEMLQVARLAPRVLGDSANLVAEFLREQMNPDGGFRDRAGNSDLYYTVFGVEALVALRVEPSLESLEAYVRSFGDGDGLDFVHLACLARAWANLPRTSLDARVRDALLARIESYRSADGGYHAEPGADQGTLYGSFLALGTYQDLGAEIPRPEEIVGSIQKLRATDGGYANQHDVPLGLTPSTAAAVTLLRQLGVAADASVGAWLLSRCHPEGGFFATPLAPIPDLLSTATALHALSGMKVDIGDRKEPCLDFVDSLWSPRGGFVGSWEDDALDCEYTYYGLLALGHLSL